MARLKKIEIENFRVFEESTEFEFPPLCILTGANSSGKSSLFKALLLLSGSVNNSFYRLDFSSPLHNLGSFDDAVNYKSKSKIMGFRLHIENPFEKIIRVVKPQGRKKLDVFGTRNQNPGQEMLIEFKFAKQRHQGVLEALKISLSEENKETVLLKINTRRSAQKNHLLEINLPWILDNYDLIEQPKVIPKQKSSRKESITKTEAELNNKTQLLLKIEIPRSFQDPFTPTNNDFIEPINEANSSDDDDVGYVLEYFFENFNNLVDKNFPKKGTSEIKNLSSGPDLKNFYKSIWGSIHPNKVKYFFTDRILREVAGIQFENLEYLEAVRAKTRRIYTVDNRTTLFDELLLDYQSFDVGLEANEFLNKWIAEFEIADKVQITPISGGAGNQVLFTKNGRKFPLADLGYGVAQYLPILLKIALQLPRLNGKNFTPLKRTIILEEPETNLHPKLQSRLADMLLNATQRFEIKFIIETHSEYLIRRLQILTGEKKLQPEDTVIYYFYEPGEDREERKQVEKIKILPDGNLDNQFGSGFFDEATNMKFELLKFKSQD